MIESNELLKILAEMVQANVDEKQIESGAELDGSLTVDSK